MTLMQLHYMITISETGSLNKAAELLYVSQPSLTSAVKELEKELGITIFNRSGRGVTLTNDGAEFLLHAKQLYSQYEDLMERYGEHGTRKKKFGVSAQHYSFAVKAFVDMAKEFDMLQYEFAIRETRTAEVISDVSTLRSWSRIPACPLSRGTAQAFIWQRSCLRQANMPARSRRTTARPC